MSTTSTISVIVNGQKFDRTVEVRLTLADFLREELDLTGTHLGCEHGVCGACTILFDGQAIRSCLMLAVQANGAEITTVEGLSSDGQLNSLQSAFRENHALQCGFCTPGMLITATAFLKDNPHPTEEQAREAISGNICRCTGYVSIVNAVIQAGRSG
ncbi:MAG: (2Fe-2S)-binding protein [SAR202 cluster bacterium]|jgi:carbon-monoxide dehydrogenase small subunit|uniref:Carbon monoxide dehydrogenase small chain n=1 Tax=hydrothermal vent metagenome TaxID=652676 RepID=A0A160V6V6_9ZZZZ|nr:(2Fe-2S)-binding protein [Dehalococcoidia bacterium]MEC8855779.1 (2Fe-2S)-binding protein [Chloroflexota bacterium]MQF90730.1 (2Fe-2S)-binding protein [SAR202 cluster bacterium]MCH2498792.1 (2Fe-2S)-binding protein [Dehalococcoidia bacterium]MED5568044.1 (2Fe-2S)-binding protein [Chloroflexota bacterium]|tara:strand:+ start:985 stop:1455 length:471 start_codon:yes stop_codon:yes gene_type:complete